MGYSWLYQFRIVAAKNQAAALPRQAEGELPALLVRM